MIQRPGNERMKANETLTASRDVRQYEQVLYLRRTVGRYGFTCNPDETQDGAVLEALVGTVVEPRTKKVRPHGVGGAEFFPLDDAANHGSFTSESGCQGPGSLEKRERTPYYYYRT